MSENENNLLKKRPKKIERNQQIEPTSSFSRNSIFTTSEGTDIPKVEKKVEKTTTTRLSFRNKDRLNALVNIKGLVSVDEVLDVLLDEHEATLTPDERRELRTMVSIYEKKR
ncbi:hypothetical protein [Listeria aquatica]|uniref:hypothetical protein n=1 Tax=Listeria aquatica TaxID=1494960 RepID=UPI0031F4C423